MMARSAENHLPDPSELWAELSSIVTMERSFVKIMEVDGGFSSHGDQKG
jgi:hypothetical protein